MRCPNCGASIKDSALYCPNCGQKINQEQNTTRTPFSVFKQESVFLRRVHNGSDCFVYPNISESVLSIARMNFGIDYNEHILTIRDTSFWNMCNQGLAMTDCGIHVINDNDNANEGRFVWTWEIINHVEYKEQHLYFFDNDGNNSYIGMSYFMKDCSDESFVASIGRQLAVLLTKMAKSVAPVEEKSNQQDNEINRCIDKNDYNKAISLIRNCINQYPDFSAYYQEWLGRIYHYCLDNPTEAQKALYKAIESCSPEQTSSIAQIRHTLYMSLMKNNEIEEARKNVVYAAIYGDDENKTYGEHRNISIKEDSQNDFEIIEPLFCKSFLGMPYKKRKALFVVDKYCDLFQDRVQVLSTNTAESIIDFPIGHPVDNELYIGHPLIPRKYIPFETYQLELVEDKVREFCEIAQSLGALEIEIECQNNNSFDTNSNGNSKTSVDGNYKVIKGSGNYHNEYSHHLIDELSRSINLHQTFCPREKPHLPENLVWYENEPSWQRLVKQRMTGTLSSHEERIETKKCQMVESHEMREIKGEISSLFASMNLNWEKSDETKYQVQENAVLSIKVQFAPFDEIKSLPTTDNSDMKNQRITSNEITNEEQEYLNEVKECLVDGELGSSERRLLNKLRDKLGISEERANELEASLSKPQLSEEEKEYVEAYQDALEDGVVSEKERRLLDKLMKINGISEERAKELEKF